MYIIHEAFGAGKAVKLIQKIENVIGRKVGKRTTFSSFPITYSNDYGNFQGFYGAVGNQVIRLNFLITSSDSIYSLDIIRGDASRPEVTVDLLGFNITQIVEIIAEELSGKVEVIKESKIIERTSLDRKENLFLDWVKENKDSLELMQSKRLADVYTMFLRASEYNEEINFQSFVQLVKAYLFKRGLTNPTFRKRKKGSKDREIVDQAKQDQLQDLAASISWEKKFEYLRSAIVALAVNKIQGVVVYGSPGSGKTEEVIKTLKDANVQYRSYSGGFKNADEVFSLLTKYRNDTILVFDDADSVLKNIDLANLFKAALQNKPVRQITWRDKMIDFTSGVIFISNLTTFNSALMSRSMAIEINLTNEQMVDKIKKTLESFHPEIDMRIKEQALAFLKEWAPGVKAIDYRELEKVCIAIEIQGNDWKNFAILMLSSQ